MSARPKSVFAVASVAVTAVFGLSASSLALAAEPTTQDLLDQIKQLQSKVEQLEARQNQTSADVAKTVDQIVKGQPVTKEVYPHQIAFNVLPHVDSFLSTGYTKEEMKMENEGRKIMHHPNFRASVTCVRVPVYRSHSVAVNAEFDKPVTVEAARAVLKKAPGLDLEDEPENQKYPMPLFTSEKYNCAVGRIRKDCALDNGLCFWVSGDQLLKGAALNAVQIAEELVK